MMSSYVVVRNRNRRNLPLPMLVLLGATDDRSAEGKNTGQGFGTKYSAASCLAHGLRYVRASEDMGGRYVAEYKSKVIMIEGRDKPRHQIYLDVRRDGGKAEVLETSMLVEMVGNAWSDPLLGLGYAIMREVVLDASDEDDGWSIGFADGVEFAPSGWTYTYITSLDKMDDGSDGPAEVVREFQYFFKEKSATTRLGPRVSVTPASSVNEVRFFLTAETAPLAYVAYSTGDGVPTPVFDYVVEETPREKLASVPDRTVRDADAVKKIIYQAYQKADAGLLATALRGVIEGSWEASLNWMTNSWSWRKDVVRDAFSRITNLPVHNERSDMWVREARSQGVKFLLIPYSLYDLAEECGVLLLKNCLNVVDPEKEVFRPPTRTEAASIQKAVSLLKGRGIGDYGHIFMVIEGGKAGERTLGVHDPSYGGMDVIGLHVERIGKYAVGETADQKMAGVILHELAHHLDVGGGDWHGPNFIDRLTELSVRGL